MFVCGRGLRAVACTTSTYDGLVAACTSCVRCVCVAVLGALGRRSLWCSEDSARAALADFCVGADLRTAAQRSRIVPPNSSMVVRRAASAVDFFFPAELAPASQPCAAWLCAVALSLLACIAGLSRWPTPWLPHFGSCSVVTAYHLADIDPSPPQRRQWRSSSRPSRLLQ